jgi:hypothetical protein
VEELYSRVSTSKKKWWPSYKRRYMLAVVNLRQLAAMATSESNQINFDRNMQGKSKGRDK